MECCEVKLSKGENTWLVLSVDSSIQYFMAQKTAEMDLWLRKQLRFFVVIARRNGHPQQNTWQPFWKFVVVFSQ